MPILWLLADKRRRYVPGWRLLQYKVSQPEIRDCSWPLSLFCLHAGHSRSCAVWRLTHGITFQKRQGSSGPQSNHRRLSGPADYSQGLNNFSTGLWDKGQHTEREQFTRTNRKEWRYTLFFSLSCCMRLCCSIIMCLSVVVFFLQLHKLTLISSYASLCSLCPPPLPSSLPPSQCPASTGATAGSSGVPQQKGMHRNNNRTFSQSETMNEPHTKHKLLGSAKAWPWPEKKKKSNLKNTFRIHCCSCATNYPNA